MMGKATISQMMGIVTLVTMFSQGVNSAKSLALKLNVSPVDLAIS
jgi:hypothetical protein